MLLRTVLHRVGLLVPLGLAVVHRRLLSNVSRPSHVLLPSPARASRSAALFLSPEINRDQAGRNTKSCHQAPTPYAQICSHRGDLDVSLLRCRKPCGCQTPTPEMVRPGAGEEIGDFGGASVACAVDE